MEKEREERKQRREELGAAPCPPRLPGDALTFSRGENRFNRGLGQSSVEHSETLVTRIPAEKKVPGMKHRCPDPAWTLVGWGIRARVCTHDQ